MSSSRHSGGPVRIGKLLETTKAAAARAAGIAIDQQAWRELVGDRVAARTRPTLLSRQTLLVETASAVWAQELSLLSPEILRRLRERGLDVQSLRFKVTPAPRPQPRRSRAAPVARPAPLPADLAAQLALLPDPSLAQLIADTAARTIARNAELAAGRPSTSMPRSVRAPRGAEPETSLPDRSESDRSGDPPRSREE